MAQKSSHSSFLPYALGAAALALGGYFLFFRKSASAATPPGQPDLKAAAAGVAGVSAASSGNMNIFAGVWDNTQKKWTLGPSLAASNVSAQNGSDTIKSAMTDGVASTINGGGDIHQTIPATSALYEWGIDSAGNLVASFSYTPT